MVVTLVPIPNVQILHCVQDDNEANPVILSGEKDLYIYIFVQLPVTATAPVPAFGGNDCAKGIITFDIESLNSDFRRLNRGRTVFPTETGLLRALRLASWELTKK